MNTTTDLPQALSGDYACFVICGEDYGAPVSQVRSVAYAPAVRRVPKAPAFVAGVANVGGRIVPLLNPYERFGLAAPGPEGAEGATEAGRRMALLQVDHSLYGLMVDAVSRVSRFSEDEIEPAPPILITGQARFLAGMARRGEQIVYLLDTEALVRTGLEADRQEQAAYEAFSARMGALEERAAAKPSRRFLALCIGEEIYGIDAARLREVAPAGRVEAAPQGATDLAGILRTQGGNLPVIDLQRRFDLGAEAYGGQGRVAVVDAGAYAYGILAHSVREFLTIADQDVREAPSAIAGSHIKGVGMRNDGGRMALLLDEGRILGTEEVARLQERDDIEMERRQPTLEAAGVVDTLSFVIFRVMDMEFALNLEDVSEVVAYTEVVRVPKAPVSIRGLAAIGGQPVPVMDLRVRFGLPEGGQQTRILVVGRGDAVYGIAAEAVSEILRAPGEDVLPAPQIVKGVDARFVEGIIRMDGTDRTPIVLNADALIDAG